VRRDVGDMAADAAT